MEEVERFEAEGESGRRYTVVLWANITEFRALSGEVTRHRGATVYQLLDGRHVNLKDSRTFQIFDTDEIIRKID